MTITKLTTVATLALLTAACAGPLCQTRGACNRVVLSDSTVAAEQGVVLFAFDSATLTPAGKKALDIQAKYLKNNAAVKAEVEGYTDSTGPEAYNLDLSQRRANAAKAYLVQAGVAADRLTAKGYGETGFVADNATAEGRAQNRRIELAYQ